MKVTTVGLDLAKNVFQVHGITDEGQVVFNKPLRRAQLLAFFERLDPCLIGMEACSASHHWARELSKFGHEVRLIPPIYVKPYVKRGKSDAVDAEAICEAVTRPTMRFVQVKSVEQQAMLSLHRMRELVVRQRTQLGNMLRGLLAEFGITLPQGLEKATGFARDVLGGSAPDIPEIGQDVIRVLCRQLLSTDYLVRWHDLRLQTVARADHRMKLLQTIPGVGPVTASAIVATIGSGRQFRNGREFAAWLGLTPRNNSSGGKERLGRITKMGDQYLRKLLVVGMTSRATQVKVRPDKGDPWLRQLLERKPFRLATIAMANKTARIIWAVLTREEAWSPRPA
ncbi:IS110 family transposase [Pseudooceanicola sp. CBS1P-1]|uniref:IS110 family transposase n=1 Tax=Pseudooceanicola albus TaxID=2692189 RepID=A0A6L7GC10_9RHOB|nr:MULTISPECIES: IS110 family transposase [Pseudooceanicola]MBT9387068.1 IS110 family transposase [Pseudooceanicola endophyticus]MXN21242.1 IS110 family transposase [Pseudooceanicola albus]